VGSSSGDLEKEKRVLKTKRAPGGQKGRYEQEGRGEFPADKSQIFHVEKQTLRGLRRNRKKEACALFS